MMMRQIDAVPFKWKYSSGVISFAKEDNPTEAQINHLMEDFEQLAFAGLPLSSHSILWVQHEENGRKELHFILPRQEVHTGKSFNAFPPGWEKKFDVLRDKYNYAHGWARPDDPARARPVQPGRDALIAAEAQRRGKTSKSLKIAISEKLIDAIQQGKIHTRNDILQTLKNMGYAFSRIGKDYITIINPTDGKHTRLKGTLYTEDFSSTIWLENQKTKKIDNTANNRKSAEAARKLWQIVNTTATYNKKRYSTPQSYYNHLTSIKMEPTKEYSHDHHIHNTRSSPSHLPSGRSQRENVASPGRTRSDYPSMPNTGWQRGNQARVYADLQLYQRGIDSIAEQPSAREHRIPDEQQSTFGAPGQNRNLHGANKGTIERVPAGADGCTGTGVSDFGRIAGGQNKALRRYDESNIGRNQWTKRADGQIGNSILQITSEYEQAAFRLIQTFQQGSRTLYCKSDKDIISTIRRKAQKVTANIFIQRLAQTLFENHCNTRLRLQAPPTKNASAGLLPAIHSLAQQLTVSATLKALIISTWDNQLHVDNLTMPVTTLHYQQNLLAKCLQRAQRIAVHTTISTLSATLYDNRLHAVLHRNLPQHVHSAELLANIRQKAERVACQSLITHTSHNHLQREWKDKLVPLNLPNNHAQNELLHKCADKAEQLSESYTVKTLAQILHESQRQTHNTVIRNKHKRKRYFRIKSTTNTPSYKRFVHWYNQYRDGLLSKEDFKTLCSSEPMLRKRFSNIMKWMEESQNKSSFPHDQNNRTADVKEAFQSDQETMEETSMHNEQSGDNHGPVP